MNRLTTKTQNQCTGFLRTSVWPLYVCGSSVGILNIKIMNHEQMGPTKSQIMVKFFMCRNFLDIGCFVSGRASQFSNAMNFQKKLVD